MFNTKIAAQEIAYVFRRRCLYFLLACLALVTVFHGRLLPLFAYPLVRSDPLVDAEVLLILRRTCESLPAYPFAADYVRSDPKRRVLVLRDYERRAERVGADPDFVEITTQLLMERGVPRDRIEVIGDGSSMTPSELIRDAARWLSERPDSTKMLVGTHSFDCGYLVHCAKSIDPDVRRNMYIVGFEQNGVNRNNWWKNAEGLKSLLRQHLRLLHLRLFGDNRPDVDWDLDAYERGLRERRRRLADEFPLEKVPIDFTPAGALPMGSQPLLQEQG